MERCILIIEDDTDTSEMMGYLAEMLHFKVIFSRVLLPVDEIKHLAPNLILLDYRLSNGLGSRLCLDLKSAEQTNNIPIILLSAAGNIDQIAKACCADHFIAKPFDLDDLEKSILKYIC